MKKINQQPTQSDIVLYTTPKGAVKIDVLFQNETVWLTINLIADLFDTTKQNVSFHLQNVFESGELQKSSTVKKILTVQKEGARKVSRKLEYYSLDAIISVGYRVNSRRATQFRIWATQRLKEYIIKGFTLDDERLKHGGARTRYFEELLQRIRDIRSSERNLYQKVTDIYATSVDYRRDDALTKEFFATVQNKMHYAVHGFTAAEIIAKRADSNKPLMGLTSFKGDYVTTQDVTIAKNYLTEEELKQLNLIVSFYLDFAELQATNKRPMRMIDWMKKLDEFLRLSERSVLAHAGTTSAKKAEEKARLEFEKYRALRNKNYISDFDREVVKLVKKKTHE